MRTLALALAILLVAHGVAAALSGDVNGDNSVNVQDLFLIAACVGQTPSGSCASRDVTGDARIDIFDFVAVARSWGLSSSPPPPTGLVAAYGFDEGSGLTSADASGNGNTMTLVNGPTWSTAGKFNKAVSLDGVNDYIQAASSNSLNSPTNAITVELWINPVDTTSDSALLAKPNVDGSNAATPYQYGMEIDGNGGETLDSFLMGTSGSNFVLSNAQSLVYGSWNHVAFTYDGATLKWYRNGLVTASSSFNTAIQQRATPLRLGVDAALGQPYKGLIDEVRIYNRALTQAEIQADMNAPVGAPLPPDTTNPSVSVTAPANGATLSAATTLSATASDDRAVQSVQFLLDGSSLGPAVTSAPYSYSFTPAIAQNGAHTISARATDTSGNTATSSGVSVTIAMAPDTTPPTASITAPSANQILAAGTPSTTLSATTNEASTCRWSATDVAYASMTNTFSTTGGTSHSTTLTGLVSGQAYTRYVRCQDQNGNPMTASQSRSFSVAAAPVCGNNIIEGTEECDGTALGGSTCASFGYTGGTLSCSACAFSTASCTGLNLYPNKPASYTRTLAELDLSQAVPPGGGERFLAGFPNTWSIVDGSGTITQMADPSAPQSPTSVWRVFEAKGVYDTGVPGTGGSSGFGRWGLPINSPSVYGSIWVKWSPGFVHHPVSEKFIRMDVAGAQQPFLIQASHGNDFLRASDEEAGIGIEPIDGTLPTGGVWHHIEFVAVRGSSGSLKAWSDGVLRVNYNGPMALTGNFATFEIHSTMGGGGMTLNADQWFMVDHIFLASP